MLQFSLLRNMGRSQGTRTQSGVQEYFLSELGETHLIEGKKRCIPWVGVVQ